MLVAKLLSQQYISNLVAIYMPYLLVIVSLDL